jgi:exodeoxyribonuclease VII large subunit
VPAVDCIALVRGGGSLEDLWSFNEEVLVRAIAAAPIPVVCGVGHEIDVTLADLAADVRALTPTDAAARVAPDGRRLAADVAGAAERLRSALARRVETARDRLRQLAGSRIFADPTRIVRDRRDATDQQVVRLARQARVAVSRGRERLGAATARLEAGSPLRLLARGWSATFRDGDPSALRSVAGLRVGDPLVTRLADGQILSRLESIAPDDAP